MATVGLRDLFYAKRTVAAGTGAITFGSPTRMAKAIKVEMATEFTEAELWADDGPDSRDREFEKGTIKLNVNDLENTARADLFGETVSEDGKVTSRTTDDPPEVALGFRAKKSGAKGRYKYVWLYNVKFDRPNEDYQTRGPGGIEYKTPEVTGKITPEKDGTWKTDWTGLETDDTAKSWFESVVDPVPVATIQTLHAEQPSPAGAKKAAKAK